MPHCCNIGGKHIVFVAEEEDMLFKNIKVDGLNIFYREAGQESAPRLVLLHGFPASSHPVSQPHDGARQPFSGHRAGLSRIWQFGHARPVEVCLHF
jgi:hypothetical protein